MRFHSLAKSLHASAVRRAERYGRDFVEADQIDPAGDAAEDGGQFVGMAHIVVQTIEDDVFERHSSLSAEVVSLDPVERLQNGESLFSGHQRPPLFGERAVQADCQMAQALCEEALQAFGSDRRHCDALRTPAHTPRLGQGIETAKHFVRIIEGFAHAHIDEIGQLGRLFHGEDLVQDLGCGEITVPSLFAGHTEEAVHLTADLRGDTKRGSVAIGDKHRFHETPFSYGEEILLGPVHRTLDIRPRVASEVVGLCQLLPIGLRYIRHLGKIGSTPYIDPFGQLLACKPRHTHPESHCGQLFERHAQKHSSLSGLCLLLHFTTLYYNVTTRRSFIFFFLIRRGFGDDQTDPRMYSSLYKGNTSHAKPSHFSLDGIGAMKRIRVHARSGYRCFPSLISG